MPTLTTLTLMDTDNATGVIYTPIERFGNRVTWVDKQKEPLERPSVLFDYTPANGGKRIHKYVLNYAWPIVVNGEIVDIGRINTNVIIPVSMSTTARKSMISQGDFLLGDGRITQTAMMDLESIL